LATPGVRADFFAAFLLFAMSVRFFKHVGCMVSIPRDRGQ
jgi:hypothetical protein